MADWQRRSVLKTGTMLLTGGLLSSVGSADPQISEPEVPIGEAQTPIDEAQGVFENFTDWSSDSGNPGNIRFVSCPDGFQEPEAIAWQYDRTGSAAVTNGMVYLQTDGEIHALDADDGSLLWAATDSQYRATPAVANETVYAIGDQLMAFEANSGDVRWSTRLDTDAVSSAPIVAFETVYVVADGTLYAFDTADGSSRWEHESISIPYEPSQDGSPSETSYVFNTQYNSLAVSDGTLWALLDDRASDNPVGTDAVAAFDPLTGEIQWSAHLEPGYYASGLAVTEDTLFIENMTEEGVMVFDRAADNSGDLISDALVTATINGYTVTRGQYNLAMHNSETSWWKDGPYQYGPPTIAGDTVVVAHSINGLDTPDEIVGLDLESGVEQWRFTFDEDQWDDGFNIDCIVDGETVYVNRDDGLTALR